MERESNQMQTLCRSGCGFYGSPATDGLCSLCYKEALKKKQQLPNTPSSHCNALSMTSAATPTTNHLNPLVSSHQDFNQAESMSQSHLPSKKSSQELSNHPSNTLVPGASVQNRPGDKDASAHDVVSTSSLHPLMEGRVASTTDATVFLEGAVDQSQAATTSTPESLSAQAEASPSAVPGVSTDSAEEDKDGDKNKKKKNRCLVCRKKVGLTGFECRCGGLFCGIHRYSDKHNCDFDYRELGAKEIRRNNPVVVGEKIQKI